MKWLSATKNKHSGTLADVCADKAGVKSQHPQPEQGFVSAACREKTNCNRCFSLRCSCHCHDISKAAV